MVVKSKGIPPKSPKKSALGILRILGDLKMENPGGTWLELLNSLAEKEIFFFKEMILDSQWNFKREWYLENVAWILQRSENLGPKFHPPKPRPFWGFLFDTQTEGLGGYFPTWKGFDGDRHSHVCLGWSWPTFFTELRGWNVAIDPETLTTVHIFFQMRTDSFGTCEPRKKTAITFHWILILRMVYEVISISLGSIIPIYTLNNQ